MIDVLKYGMISNDEIFDNTSIFNYILTLNDNKIYFPPGNYFFLTPPNPINKIIVIFGESMSNSVLIRKYQPLNEWDSFLRLTGSGGSRIENLSILTDKTVKNGVGLTLDSQPTGESPDFTSIMNVNISHNGNEGNNGTWKRAMWLHGAQRQNLGPKGLRDINVQNVFLFASTHSSLEINSVHDAYLLISCYPAGGITDLININAFSNSPCNNIICNIKSRANINIVPGTLTKSLFISTDYLSVPKIKGVKFL